MQYQEIEVNNIFLFLCATFVSKLWAIQVETRINLYFSSKMSFQEAQEKMFYFPINCGR